jgi:putative copper export protein
MAPSLADHFESISKIGLYLALFLVLGSHVTRWLLRVVGEGREAPGLTLRSSRLTTAAVIGFLGCHVLRLSAHSLATFGIGDIPTFWNNIWLIALESRWGRGWRLQLGVALGLLLLSVWTLRSSGVRPLLASSLAAVALVLTLPAMGHASGDLFRTTIDVLHVLGGGMWLGTLAVFFLVKPRDELLARFSPLALTGAAVAALTGLLMAWLYLGSAANVSATSYGRLLAVKAVAVAAVGACGLVNWRKVHAGQTPWLMGIELVFGVFVVILTAFLTEMAHP